MQGVDQARSAPGARPGGEPPGAPGGGRAPGRKGRGTLRSSGPEILLAAVAVCYALAQILLVTPGIGFGNDEAVYANQFSANGPGGLQPFRGWDMGYHSSRGWGTPILVAPVVMFTDSIEALRLYLTLVSSSLLFAAFRVWLSVRLGYAVPAAAAIFAGSWATVFYGNAVMPNLYTALGAVALTGLILRGAASGASPGRATLVMVAVATAVLPLFRPSDALVITCGAAGGTAVLLLSRRHRRPAFLTLTAVGAGAVVGYGMWVLESLLRYGNIPLRLKEATRMFGDPQWLVEHHVRVLDGPTVCTTLDGCGPVTPGGLVWLAGLALLVGAGLLSGLRRGHGSVVVIPVVVGACIAAAYLYYPGQIAPRYMLPAYGLWAIAAGEGLRFLIGTLRRRTRAVYAVACCSLVLGGYLHLQSGYLTANVGPQTAGRAGMRLAAERIKEIGYGRPCLVYGWNTTQVSYYLGCEALPEWNDRPLPAVPRDGVEEKLAEGATVILLYRGDADRNASYFAFWPEYRLTRSNWYARISPGGLTPPPGTRRTH